MNQRRRRKVLMMTTIIASILLSQQQRASSVLCSSCFLRRFQAAAFTQQAVNMFPTATRQQQQRAKLQQHPKTSPLYYLSNVVEEDHRVVLPQQHDIDNKSMETVLTPAPIYKPLDSDKLRWKCPSDKFNFDTTNDLEGLPKGILLNQKRASTAIEFGIGMKQDGYNLYVLGPSGSGKRTLVRDFLDDHSLQEPAASDWAYVYNFESPDCPKALKLPAGMGKPLEDDLEQLIEDIQITVPAVLKSKEHEELVKEAKDEIFKQQNKKLNDLAAETKKHDLSFVQTSKGFALAGIAEEMDNVL